MKKLALLLVVVSSLVLSFTPIRPTNNVPVLKVPSYVDVLFNIAKYFQPTRLIGCYPTAEARTAAKNTWLAEKHITIISAEEEWINSTGGNMGNQFCLDISGSSGPFTFEP